MGKIFINKNGKTFVHNVIYENSKYTYTETRLSFLYGDKIVFVEDFQPIDNGDYLFANCNIECVKGVLNVQNTAHYMFSTRTVSKNIDESLSYSLTTPTRLREVDLKCSALGTDFMFSDNGNLETVKLELPNSTTMRYCFSSCVKLKNVSLIAPNVYSCERAFTSCSSL
jgi:hypothetical protein